MKDNRLFVQAITLLENASSAKAVIADKGRL